MKSIQNISLIFLSFFLSMTAFSQKEKSTDHNKQNVELEKTNSIHNRIKDSSYRDNIHGGEAKIAIELETDSKGEVVKAEYISKKSIGSISQGMIDVAKRRAYQLKLGANVKETVIFNFKIR